jgi:hypothetical protein
MKSDNQGFSGLDYLQKNVIGAFDLIVLVQHLIKIIPFVIH